MRRSHLRVVPPTADTTETTTVTDPDAVGGLTPEQAARVVDLPDSLRTWAREEPLVRLCLARHIREGVPLTECLTAVARTLGDDGLTEVRARVLESNDPTLLAWLGPRPTR